MSRVYCLPVLAEDQPRLRAVADAYLALDCWMPDAVVFIPPGETGVHLVPVSPSVGRRLCFALTNKRSVVLAGLLDELVARWALYLDFDLLPEFDGWQQS
jgi:hypothetical protein